MSSKQVDMKTIFSSVKGTTSKDEQVYNTVEKRFKGENKLGPINDLTTLTKWFQIKYEKVYNKPMIGYNYFNCRKTFQQLGIYYGMTNWEVACFVNSCFTKFHGLGFDKVACDNTLTLSVLKTGWVVDGLVNNKRPGENARNSSFKRQSTSRRQTVTSRSEIHNIGF